MTYKYIIASIVMFIISLIIGYVINNHVVSILVQVFVSCIVYLSSLFLLRDKMLLEGINIVKLKIKH